MLSWSRPRKPAPPTLNERIDAFWQWFTEVGPRFYAAIDAGNCGTLSDEVSAKIDELFPGFAWVFGPGEQNVGHSFTLTGEGVIHRQLVTQHWLKRAPQLAGWTFYAARQPGLIDGRAIVMEDRRFGAEEIWVTAHFDSGTERVNLTVWHPSFADISEKQRAIVTFLFLDESLGEYGTEWYIGALSYGRDKLADSFPLVELADHISRLAAKHDLKGYPPGQSYTGYRIDDRAEPPDGPTFPRSDTVYLTTAAGRLFVEFLNAAGDLDDPLKGTGADYVFVSIAREFFSEGAEVKGRGEIEDAIEAKLAEADAGRCVGGATGTHRMYSDFLIYDGQRSIDLIVEVLKERGIPPGTIIEYVAREKRGSRIAL